MRHALDREVSLNKGLYSLRFSMGALAKISTQLGAAGPLELAEMLRVKEAVQRKKTALIIVNSLLLRGRILDISNQDLNVLMPVIADMIVEAFHG